MKIQIVEKEEKAALWEIKEMESDSRGRYKKKRYSLPECPIMRQDTYSQAIFYDSGQRGNNGNKNEKQTTFRCEDGKIYLAIEVERSPHHYNEYTNSTTTQKFSVN